MHHNGSTFCFLSLSQSVSTVLQGKVSKSKESYSHTQLIITFILKYLALSSPYSSWNSMSSIFSFFVLPFKIVPQNFSQFSLHSPHFFPQSVPTFFITFLTFPQHFPQQILHFSRGPQFVPQKIPDFSLWISSPFLKVFLTSFFYHWVLLHLLVNKHIQDHLHHHPHPHHLHISLNLLTCNVNTLVKF